MPFSAPIPPRLRGAPAFHWNRARMAIVATAARGRFAGWRVCITLGPGLLQAIGAQLGDHLTLALGTGDDAGWLRLTAGGDPSGAARLLRLGSERQASLSLRVPLWPGCLSAAHPAATATHRLDRAARSIDLCLPPFCRGGETAAEHAARLLASTRLDDEDIATSTGLPAPRVAQLRRRPPAIQHGKAA